MWPAKFQTTDWSLRVTIAFSQGTTRLAWAICPLATTHREFQLNTSGDLLPDSPGSYCARVNRTRGADRCLPTFNELLPLAI